jgi:hypothetical protein
MALFEGKSHGVIANPSPCANDQNCTHWARLNNQALRATWAARLKHASNLLPGFPGTRVKNACKGLNNNTQKPELCKFLLKSLPLDGGASGENNMHWPFKTTAKFRADDGRELRLEYLASANNSVAAKYELERRLIGQEVFGYTIEKVEPATKQEAALFKLPAGCIQLLG